MVSIEHNLAPCCTGVTHHVVATTILLDLNLNISPTISIEIRINRKEGADKSSRNPVRRIVKHGGIPTPQSNRSERHLERYVAYRSSHESDT
jgi:hypothetical protein